MTDSYGHCYRCYSDDEGTHCSPNGEAQPPFDGSSSSDAPTSYREGLRAMRETLRGDDAKALFNFIKDVGVDSVYENGERVRKAFGFGCASGPTVKLDCVIAKNNLDHLTSLSSDDNPKAFKLIEKIIDLIDRQMNSDRIRRTFEQQNAVIFQDVTCSQSRCTMRVIAR